MLRVLDLTRNLNLSFYVTGLIKFQLKLCYLTIMIALKVFAVFVLCCSLGANAQIKCLQGQTTPEQPASRLLSGSCPSGGDNGCARFDIDIEVTAIEGKF